MCSPWRFVAVGKVEPLLLQPEVALLFFRLVKGLKAGLGHYFLR